MRILSSVERKAFFTITSYVRLCVKLLICVEYTSPSMFMLWVFFANTTGQLKYCAVMHAIPMPEASMVSILFMLLSGNSLRNSLPISLISAISIWWLRKLSTLRTFPSLITPSFLILSFKSSISAYLSVSSLPISTPITEAIISPLVQPLESPRQCSPFIFVLKCSSIFMRLL